jgi:uncharacterized protein YxeA
MTALLTTVVLAVGAAQAAEAPKIDGKWLIVYAEEGGKRNTTWEQRVATAEKDVLSYSKDGDDRQVKLSFGAKQTATATLKAGGKDLGAMSGVYISGQDYLCLSLNPDAAKGGGGSTSSGAFILILRRQR